eukprot:7339822-Prymnesium_polylepis.1
MMRVAWEADVRRGLAGASALNGGVASAVWLCIKGRQMKNERDGKRVVIISMSDKPMTSPNSSSDTSMAPDHHDNASMVLMQLAFMSDDPAVLVALYQWTPDWRIR